MQIEFRASPRPTLGIEWEFALVDRDTRDLANCAAALFDTVLPRLPDPGKLHQELLRNTVEVVSGICGSVGEAMADLRSTLDVVAPAAHELGADLYCAGTHPFAEWTHQQLTPGHRYEELINRTQWWGRQMLIWGVHVHVGMPEVDRVMPVLSSLLNQYPHLQALSASSPVWAGVDTGYASNRAMMFQQLPTAGLPFQFETWAEYERFVHDQVTTGIIEDLHDIRWDIRPSGRLGTIENRACDGISTFEELAAADRAHALPGGRPRPAARRRGDPADAAALARAGEQVARGPLRARGRGDRRRPVPRAPGHRRPRRPARAAVTVSPGAWTASRSCARSPTSRAGVRRTSGSGRWRPPTTATWSPWWTRWSGSCATPWTAAGPRPPAPWPADPPPALSGGSRRRARSSRAAPRAGAPDGHARPAPAG